MTTDDTASRGPDPLPNDPQRDDALSNDGQPNDAAPNDPVPNEGAPSDAPRHDGAPEQRQEFADWFDREFDQRGDTLTGEPGASDVTIDTVTTDPGTTAADTAAADTTDAHTSDPGTSDADPSDGDRRSWAQRMAARVVRRPVAWWRRPWTTRRVVEVLVTTVVLATTTVVMMMVVHFNPVSPGDDLIFDVNTPTGGDMGAHVWAPAFLRDHFLPKFELSGWSMDWYGGLPLYRFYMVTPALAIVVLDVVLPYGVAFKIIAISGLVAFPFACWAFGRLASFRHPIPELFAVGGVCFLLDESFSIYGGNVKSTMAGEYSFSIALTLTMIGLGLLANGLRTGRFRVWTAVVLALAAVSHGIVLIFVAVAAVVFCLVWIDRWRLVYALTTGITTLLLAAWWVGPFLFGHEFMTDMKYGFRPEGASDSFWDMFFPLAAPLNFIITGLAIVGFVALVMRRNLNGTAIGVTALVLVGLVYVTRDSLPVIGLLWNPRLLPFLYLLRYLLMVVGALEVITWIFNVVRGRLASARMTTYENAFAAGAITLSCLLVFGWMYETLPFDGRRTDGDTSVYAWGPLRKTPDAGRAVADGWARYNFTGYEGKPAYPEYYDVVSTMDGIGQTRGCGRALWENNSDNGQYGTTMALMLLPHWTDGCIASMEGLFFEASGTTPYSFLASAAVSESSSNPVRELRYTNNDAAVGVQHMNDLGVRYLMVRTDAAKEEAAAQDELELVATSGPWEIYELGTASIVEPLTVQPVVVNDRAGDQRERNLELGTSWFQRREDWPAIPADDGPESWQRIDVEIDLEARVGEPGERSRNVDYVVPVEPIEAVALPEVEVTDVEMGQEEIRFEVDEVGVPVLVRVSYFPNWRVEGAEGPYRVSPNHMVVIPTSNEVVLSYGRTALDWFFYALTVIGIGLCVFWRRRGDMRFPSERPYFGPVPAGFPAPGAPAAAAPTGEMPGESASGTVVDVSEPPAGPSPPRSAEPAIDPLSNAQPASGTVSGAAPSAGPESASGAGPEIAPDARPGTTAADHDDR